MGRSVVNFGLQFIDENFFIFYVHSDRTNLQAACLVKTSYLITYYIVDTTRRFFLPSPILSHKVVGWPAEMMVWIYNTWKLRLDDTYTSTNLEPSRPSRGEHKTTTKRWTSNDDARVYELRIAKKKRRYNY